MSKLTRFQTYAAALRYVPALEVHWLWLMLAQLVTTEVPSNTWTLASLMLLLPAEEGTTKPTSTDHCRVLAALRVFSREDCLPVTY